MRTHIDDDDDDDDDDDNDDDDDDDDADDDAHAHDNDDGVDGELNKRPTSLCPVIQPNPDALIDQSPNKRVLRRTIDPRQRSSHGRTILVGVDPR